MTSSIEDVNESLSRSKTPLKALLKVILATCVYLEASTANASSSNAPFAGFEYQNPIHFDKAAGWYKDRLRDPHIVRDGDTYYLTHSMVPVAPPDDADPTKRDFGSAPGIRLYSTKDFKDWKAECWLVKSDQLPPDCPYKHQFFAPEINRIKGRYYLVFFACNWIKESYNPARFGEAFVGVADRITGPYEHITLLPGAWCDATFFEADDGQVYCVMMGGKGLDVQQVDLSGIDRGDIKLVGERKVAVDKKNLPAGDGQTWNLEHTEGPWVVRRNGRYYLFFASLTAPPGKPREYWTGVAYSEHPMGPWERDFPRGPHRGIFLGGHLSVFDGPDGRFWYAYKNEKFNPGGDDFLCIDPIDLLPDGRVAYREPTPYDQLVQIGRDGTTATIEATPKPPPTYPEPPPFAVPKVLSPLNENLPPAVKVCDWDFGKTGNGDPATTNAPLTSPGKLFFDATGHDYCPAVPIGTPSGPRVTRYAVPRDHRDLDGYALDTREGALYFPPPPEEHGKHLCATRNLSAWARVKFSGSSSLDPQVILSRPGNWIMFRRPSDDRLELNIGTRKDILKGQGPAMKNNLWYEVGFSLKGDASFDDLHEDQAGVYLDGREVAEVTTAVHFRGREALHLGCVWGGNWRAPALFDRVILWDGVASADEFADLSGLAGEKR